VLYRLHPGLLIYPARIAGERVLVAELSSSKPPLILRHPRIPWAITVLPERFTAADARARWTDDRMFAEHAEAFWEVLINEGLAICNDNNSATVRRFDAWSALGWAEASLYHEATRDYPFLKMDEPDAFPVEEARMVEYVKVQAPPSIYQTRPSAFTVSLPARLPRDATVVGYLTGLTAAERRGLAGLGLLLDYCYGERGTEPFGVQGRFLRKTIPSGGARHPTEVFLAAFAGAPVDPGVYHYNVEHHRLDCVHPGDHRDAFEHATFDLFQKFDRPPFGLLVFTSLVERAMWRYREARSARAVLVDVGHALMVYRGIAAALGIGVYTYQKVRDAAISVLLGVDPLTQPPLFVGTLV
jgi:SagB-type dehydrogenase family enzyme